ncbi:MAG: ABC transporter permease [Candidatus Aminicenantes bacterium]|nr:MAG: ABC transporter permease [Candidatus Aminicenantes bacterium]
MFKNYLKIAWRNLAKQKVYSAINILGLAVGLAGAILAFLFVQNELSYDRFHKNTKNLYRLHTIFHAEDGSIERNWKSVTMPMGPAVEEYFPEITHSIRVSYEYATVKTGERLFREKVTMVDKPFFQVFSFPLITGNPSSVFSQDYSLILTENHARKYFGDVNPVGQILTLIYGNEESDFVVGGVTAQPPSDSSITFDILIDIESANRLNMNASWLDNWGGFAWQNYVLLQSRSSVDSILQKFPGFTNQYYASFMERYRERRGWKREGPPISFGLQPISRVHLDPQVKGSLNLNAVFILSGIAFIVLLVACINFMNLSVGRASTRSLEVGMRKVLGAERRQLIHQFWGEFLVTTGIAMIAGLLLAEVLLPTFNRLSGKSLSLKEIFQPINLLILLILFIIVGIASGSYPALVMSRFRPAEIFRGKLKIGGKKPMTRALVVVQFALSVFLIIATIIMGRQIHFMLTADPGFNKEGVVAVKTQEPDEKASNAILKLFRDRLNQQPNIVSISGITAPIGWVGTYRFKKDDREIDVYQNRVDYDFFKTMGIEMVQGRTFSREFPTDVDGVIINEKLVKELEIEDPIGKSLKGYEMPLTIIGVCRDYITEDFRHSILPALLHIKPDWRVRDILVRISPKNISETLSLLERTWKDIQPNKPFLYSFLDESMEELYNDEKRWGAIVGYSTALAVIIACMGIFGLTSITVNRRTKEIGIRKVLGASVPQIINILTREFIWLVGIANIIGWPTAYFAMRNLLNNYYYRISLGAQYFLLAGVLSFFVAVLTTAFLAVRTAVANPVDSLRHE